MLFGFLLMRHYTSTPVVSAVEAKTSTVTETVYVSGIVAAEKEYPLYGPVGAKVNSVLVRLGQRVSRGAELVVFDDSEIRLQISQAQRQLDILKIQLKAYENSKNSIPVSSASPLTLEDQISIQRLQISNQEAFIRSLEKELLTYTLRAPTNGVVGAVNVATGQVWQGIQPAVVVLADSSKKVSVMLNPIDASNVKTGQKALVRFGGSTLTGTVVFVSQAAVNGSVPADIVIESKDIPVGASVDVEVVVREMRGLVVPASALVYQKDGTYALKVVEDGVVRTRSVEIVAQTASEAVVEGGIAEGDTVLTGNLDIRDGQRVRVR